jgi:hypothetical protein
VQLRLRARPVTVTSLYLAALAAMYALVLLYRERGFWVEAP